MKKFVFYPILFSINPALLLYAVNINDVNFSLLFPLIPIVIIAVIISMWILNKWLKDKHREGFIVFIFSFWFFYYVPMSLWVNNLQFLPNFAGHDWIIYVMWCLAFIFLSSRWLWKKITSPETITMVLNYFCIILVSISIFRIAKDLLPRYLMGTDESELVQTLSRPESISDYPDIYYIILDGYARNDILEELYYYDNSTFTKELNNRGFYIATQSQSNYVQTVLSLASSLNMEYLSGLPGMKPNQGQLLGMIDKNKTRMLLSQVGYKTVAFSTGYEATDLKNADYYYSPLNIGKSHDLEALLMINSVLDPFIQIGWITAPITKYRAGQDRVNNILNTLEKDVPLINDPKFVFAHIVAPHPPFIFDQYGPISPDETLILQGADTFQGSRDDYIQGYISDLIYINNRVLQTIDGILSHSKRRPIIILQADHGPDAYFGWNKEGNNCFKERFSILNAFYLPDEFPPMIALDLTPVNTFAMILNEYFKADIKIQTNHEYFATWENSYPFNDVSTISQTCHIK